MIQVKRTQVAAGLLCAAMWSGSSAFGAVFTHVKVIDLGADTVNGFNGTTLNGNSPLSVTFDGTNAYVGGYNNTGLAASVGVVKVGNVVGAGAATLASLAASQFTSPAARGIDAVAYEPTTASIVFAHDAGTAAASFITRRRAVDGTIGTAADSSNDWTTTNPQSLRPWAMGIDPIGDGTAPGVAFFASGQGRRLMLKLSDGSVVYTIGGGANPGGIINPTPTALGTTWRSVAFDPAGNIALGAAWDSTKGGYMCGLRNSANQWKTLDGLTVSATSSAVARNSTGSNSNNVGQGVALLHDIDVSEPELLAFSVRLADTITPQGGSPTPVIDSQVHIRARNGSASGVAVTELTGNEDGIGTAWATTSNIKNLAYGKDGSGNSYLLVLDLAERRLDVYQVKKNPPACQRTIWADADGDGDVDQDDFGAFQLCYDPQGTTLSAACVCLDRTGDQKIDASDFGDPLNVQSNTFVFCHSGSGLPPAPSCVSP